MRDSSSQRQVHTGRLDMPRRYLLVHHQVAHALCGCLSKLVVVLKHVVFDIWQGLLFDYLQPVAKNNKNPTLQVKQ